ncbi:metal-dependent phosphohydrolase [Thioalkalivibrio denitrificans]|uniref:Metal-dependent phosphohydrolase n=1 Tax=Thioalkalivibrio denitrificans TaxID=108003 RepID=A0A1V3NI16_9GAMM|nr:HDOD domain-containing protein [Thioalkalivibrio denitrificans]OOG24749.1 metal-dependent phosphohydrolase [Thioalkalivibrio denitrificans]
MSSTPDATPELLERLVPINELTADDRERLASKATMLDLEPGTRLEARNEYRWLDYLLSGKVNLVSSGKPLVINPDSERGAQPIFLKPRPRDYAIILTPARLMRVDRQLYETLRNAVSQSGIEIEDMNLSDTEGEIFAGLYQACLSNALELPAMPEVALEINKAAEDPDMDLSTLARVVQMDMAVTGSLIKAANSAMYGGSAPVSHVRGALQRLGMDSTRQLVMGIAMGRVFRSETPGISARMHELWDHSVHVSALSFVIARHCGGFDPDRALLAGLLHDVGAVPILEHIGRHEPDIEPQALEDIVERLHGLTGELVISYWGLGTDMIQVARESDLWHRRGGAEADYCDVVQVAQLYAYTQQGRTDRPHFDSVPAFERLCLSGVCDGDRLDPVDEAEAEIAAVMDILKGR